MVNQDSLRQIDHDHLLTVVEIIRLINSSLEFEQVLDDVMDAVMQVTRAQRGFLMVADPETGALETRVARSPEGEDLAPHESYSRTVVQQVVSSRAPLLTNNAQVDPQFRMAESIMINRLRAILCAPMILKERLVGIVYVDSSVKAGMFSERDVHLLNVVAGQAAIAIENARLFQVAVAKARLDREIQMAQELQRSLLPAALPKLRGYDVAAWWRSAYEMAGDFYDAFGIDRGALAVVVADVSDKGTAAALCMASTRSMIRAFAAMGLTPVEVLSRANDLLAEDVRSGMFVTAYFSLFQTDGRSVHVNAGHNPPILYRRRTDTMALLPRGGRALGWYANNPVRAHAVDLEPGDVVILYTDGIVEAENPVGEEFGEAGLMQAARHRIGSSAADIVASVQAALDAHRREMADAQLSDDCTLCVVRFDP